MTLWHFNIFSELENVIEILNSLDGYLDNKNGSVVLAVSRLFVKIVLDHPNLQYSLVQRLCPVLEKLIKSAKREFQSDLLDFALSLDKQYFAHFSKQDKFILLKPKESEDLKEKKIRFICRTARKENCIEIMNYLLNLVPMSERLNKTVLSSVCTIAALDESAHENCIKNMRLLVKTDRKMYLNYILESELRLENLQENHYETVETLVQSLLDQFQPDAGCSTVLSSVLYILENFGQMYKMSPYVLQDIFESDRSSWTEDMYSDVLAAGFSLFGHFPAAMQPILSNILHLTYKVKNHNLHCKVLTYYRLLKLMA